MQTPYVGNDPNIASVILSDDYTNPKSRIAATTKCVNDAFTDATRLATNTAYGIISSDNLTTNINNGALNVILSDGINENDSGRVPSRRSVKITYDKAIEALNQANYALERALYAVSGQRRYVINMTTNLTLDKDHHLNRVFVYMNGGYNVFAPIGTYFGNGWYCTIANYSNAIITLIGSGCTIYGNRILDTQTSVDIITDGTNWFTLDTSGKITP